MMDVWISVAIIAVVTFATRAFTVFFNLERNFMPGPAWRHRLETLGPSLIVAMAVSLLIPSGQQALANGQGGIFALAFLGAGAAAAMRLNLGVVTLIGVISWWLAESVL